jgi:hypothetical protein
MNNKEANISVHKAIKSNDIKQGVPLVKINAQFNIRNIQLGEVT